MAKSPPAKEYDAFTKTDRPLVVSASRCGATAHRRTPRSIGQESQQARTEEKDVAHRRSLRPALRAYALPREAFASCSDQFLIHQAASDDAVHRIAEPLRVAVLPVVEPERLFVQIPEQVERLDADVGALQPTLQERPEVFQPVRVDRAVDVGFGVVDEVVAESRRSCPSRTAARRCRSSSPSRRARAWCRCRCRPLRRSRRSSCGCCEPSRDGAPAGP